jgi:pre-mRNA-splicing factor CDC5/CEF1
MRYVTKGGVWKNAEDEILKAAVMKYGKNQWARISSLLVNKSAKQCKARWYEWLDPSIKKTEWTKEEEEKLLHLAKIMPCQWRTIAPLVGRTAAQCLEHYSKLLDAAQGRDEEEESDLRKPRPGEIDPNIESRPALPDPVDMDEDMKEMLSEARARLANTKGKKAKRKARERALEFARRQAALQKDRELKAAGIEPVKSAQLLTGKKRKLFIDFNAEVPFEKRAPKGFFDTREEDALANSKRITEDNFDITMVQNLEGESKEALERKAREKDAQKQKLLKKANFPKYIETLNHRSESGLEKFRPSLNLPDPQISSEELEGIAKLGSLKQASSFSESIQQTPSDSLLRDFLPLQTPTPMRTPLSQLSDERIMRQARNLAVLSSIETPLKGPEVFELEDSDFSGALPSNAPTQTPNPLKVVMTPFSDFSIPVRDSLGINTPVSSIATRPNTPNFFALPKPKNNKDPDVFRKPVYSRFVKKHDVALGEDREILALKEKKVIAERQRDDFLRRSQTFQNQLPIPPLSILEEIDLRFSKDNISSMIGLEMKVIIEEDNGNSSDGSISLEMLKKVILRVFLINFHRLDKFWVRKKEILIRLIYPLYLTSLFYLLTLPDTHNYLIRFMLYLKQHQSR